MNSCRSCGISIPDGQDFCSMCYGEIEYGTDNYYQEMLEKERYEEELNREMDRKELEEYLSSLENEE